MGYEIMKSSLYLLYAWFMQIIIFKRSLWFFWNSEHSRSVNEEHPINAPHLKCSQTAAELEVFPLFVFLNGLSVHGWLVGW